MINPTYYKIALIVIFFVFWGSTQKFLETDIHFTDKIYDRIHNSEFVQYINKYLHDNVEISNYCIIITTLLIDINVAYYAYAFIRYNNIKPIFLLLSGVLLRQLCQYVNRLPSPDNVIWHDPGIPSIIMNYNVTTDFFFSGHTLTALVLGMELFKSRYFSIKLYAIIYMICEITFVLVTKSHYFMDVYGAITTYFMLNYFFDYFTVDNRPL